MSAPIFADPFLDGAADPTVICREGTDEQAKQQIPHAFILDSEHES